jgi:hypothetical protein
MLVPISHGTQRRIPCKHNRNSPRREKVKPLDHVARPTKDSAMFSIRNSAYFHHILHPPFVNNTAYTNPYTGQESPFRFQEDEPPIISRQSAREGNKVVSPKHRPSLQQGYTLATHLC